MKRKEGTCKKCGYVGALYARGYCQFCYWKAKTNKPAGEKPVFDKIWASRPHFSYLSGLPLDKYKDTPFYVNMFSHVLSKKNYPKWKLNPDNIILLTPKEHNLFDQGTIEKREKYAKKTGADWERLYELVDEKKNEYRRIH